MRWAAILLGLVAAPTLVSSVLAAPASEIERYYLGDYPMRIAERGEARFFDALRKPRFRVRETDAGFVAILPNDTRLWLEAVPNPAKRKRR